MGFNRRFSPFTIWAKEHLDQLSGPMIINCRVNAGWVEQGDWVNDSIEGGGRVIGEVCHFVELIQVFTESVPIQVFADAPLNVNGERSDENVVNSIRMKDGSTATIVYTAIGDRAFPRERVEIFRSRSVCLIDNFKEASFVHRGSTKRKRKMSIDRGVANELKVWFDVLTGKARPPVLFTEYAYTTMTTFQILESLKNNQPLSVYISDLEQAIVSEEKVI